MLKRSFPEGFVFTAFQSEQSAAVTPKTPRESKAGTPLLQSTEAMTKTTTCVYHFLVLNWYIFLNYHIPQIGKDEEKLKEFHDGGRSKYLTLLNLVSLFIRVWNRVLISNVRVFYSPLY